MFVFLLNATCDTVCLCLFLLQNEAKILKYLFTVHYPIMKSSLV